MPSDKGYPGWVRHAGVGIELAGVTAGLALIGYWVDGHFGTRPWGIVVGVVIGIVGGMYNLVRESLQAVKDAKIEDDNARRQNDRDGNQA